MTLELVRGYQIVNRTLIFTRKQNTGKTCVLALGRTTCPRRGAPRAWHPDTRCGGIRMGRSFLLPVLSPLQTICDGAPLHYSTSAVGIYYELEGPTLL